METIFSEDDDVFRETILSMCDYHLANTRDSHLVDFNTLLSIDGIRHPLLDDFLPYFMDEFEISEQNKMILGTILD